jgi:hypothetical protein
VALSRDWRAQEKQIAKATGGSRNAGSGAFTRKGDIRAPDTLWEAKWTGKQSMTIQAKVIEKIVSEALAEGRRPVLALEMNGRNYVLLEQDDYLEDQQELDDLYLIASENG